MKYKINILNLKVTQIIEQNNLQFFPAQTTKSFETDNYKHLERKKVKRVSKIIYK